MDYRLLLNQLGALESFLWVSSWQVSDTTDNPQCRSHQNQDPKVVQLEKPHMKAIWVAVREFN